MTDTETFDLYEMAAGTTYPTDEVHISLDGKTAHEIEKLDRAIDGEMDTDKISVLEKDLDELKEKFRKSKLIVHLQGMPSKDKKKIVNTIDSEFGIDQNDASENRLEALESEFFLYSITKVTDMEGREATLKDWDRNKMSQWRLLIPEYYRSKISAAIADLSIRSFYYETAEISTDFLSRC